ncbi:NADH-ubiquinone oxidoreductase subunit [Protomyces lactucae-debilis]|uniref:NADH-ubiquinone oxidoreductase n=1 Tax=Protomyces lactucae-debilis TaxID=2754530 RepID=A0A1Y2ES55_PROLT|nr:NADH-ubiquinone oxidoreductase subunit [Protomyces lactucae-debilis]ORY74362.1 NADH-ubiquinone oxidoreductase subunit [Protomyces lactucae-debilis]
MYKEPTNNSVLIDPTPMPNSIPHVDEVGASSAPLKSVSFFIGAKCGAYNDDFMLCKAENAGKDEAPCLAAGRKVTRCASGVLEQVQASCKEAFEAHWKCLDQRNQEFHQCRPAEHALNKCVFQKMNIQKVVPGTREGNEPWDKKKPIYKPFKEDPAGLYMQKKMDA